MRKLLDLKCNGWTWVATIEMPASEGGGVFVVWFKRQSRSDDWVNVVVEVQGLDVRKRRHYLIYGQHERRFADHAEWVAFKKGHQPAAFELMRRLPGWMGSGRLDVDAGVPAIGD